MPLPGSHAFIETINPLEKLPEYKIEIICPKEQIKVVVTTLQIAHPHESSSYQAFRFGMI